MTRGRLEAFTDAVVAILMTIMVLELHPPGGVDLMALAELGPKILAYLLSFVFLAIYWNNHHHLLHTVQRIDGGVLWANMHLMFWLSLVPVVTAWLGEHPHSPAPVGIYGLILLACGFAYSVLGLTLVRANGPESTVAKVLGADGKGKASLAFYLVGVLISPWVPWLSLGLYVVVALIWLVPDRRVERVLGSPTSQTSR